MFYETIKETPHDESLPLIAACKTVAVSRDGYLKWLKRKPKLSPAAEQKIIGQIEKISAEFSYYGYRRVTKELNRRGVSINYKKVRRIMKERSLTIKIKKFKPKTTSSNHSLELFPNRTKDLVVTRINQVWVADITYIDLNGVFLYLALLTDAYSRKCVGWQLGRHMDTSLCADALRMAFAVRRGMPLSGLFHHSDHGSQYLSHEYLAILKTKGIISSTGETGVAYDNPMAESMNKSVKYEEVYRSEYLTFEDAHMGIKKYLGVYNKKRLHSSIGYVPPDEFEKSLKNCLN